MERLLAEDLHLLCWDDDEGAVASACQGRLPATLAGALVLDAVDAGAVVLEDGTVHATGEGAGDPLLDRVVDGVTGPRLLDEVVRELTPGAGSGVRDRLVADGALQVEQRRGLRRVLGRSRLVVAEPEQVRSLADEVWSLLEGDSPDGADPRTILLAALTGASGLVEGLDTEGQERADQHAAELAAAAGITPIIEAVAEAQLHDWARARGNDLAGSHRLGLAAGGLNGGVGGFDPG